MHISSLFKILFATLFMCTAFAFGLAALAQGFEVQFENGGASSTIGTSDVSDTFSNSLSNVQTSRVLPAAASPAQGAAAPSSTVSPPRQGTTNGTIGPKGSDATYVTGLNTAGTVRVNNLANMEATMNVMSNGMEVLGIAWGGPTIIMACMQMGAGAPDGWKRVMNGILAVLGGLAQPAWNNWLVACMRDCHLN